MTSAERPFQQYAGSYDEIYKDKDYAGECAFVEQVVAKFGSTPLKEILDLGCGTGGHAIPFAKKGYRVVGVDLSSEMLDRAREKAEKEGCSDRVTLIASDITAVDAGKKFDVVVCLFAVMSYLIRNEQLENVFDVAKKHLPRGGLYICDFWYGPSVLLDLPVAREKRIPINGGDILRKATPTLHLNENYVDVIYELTKTLGGKIMEKTSEQHSMRYLFLPELAAFAKRAGLELVHSCDCCKIDSAPGEKTWTVSAVFRVV